MRTLSNPRRRLCIFVLAGWALTACSGSVLPGLCPDGVCPDAAIQDTVVVDLISGISGQTAPLATISLRDHGDLFYDMTQANATARVEILESSRQSARPVYFEIEPDSRVIESYLLPFEGTVIAMVDREDFVAVEFVPSAAVHVLDRSNPDFQALRTALERSLNDGAVVLVTETPTEHEIIDVRQPLVP